MKRKTAACWAIVLCFYTVLGIALYQHLSRPVEVVAVAPAVVQTDVQDNLIHIPVPLDSGSISKARRAESRALTEALNQQSLLAMRLRLADDTPTCTPGTGDPQAGPGFMCGTWRRVNDGPWEWVR
jgi:hypothetical protein